MGPLVVLAARAAEEVEELVQHVVTSVQEAEEAGAETEVMV